ncbi:Epoxyqueuosine reductase, partial [termite gut metagenome]
MSLSCCEEEKSLYSTKIKAGALSLGFSVCGIAPADTIGRYADYFKDGLAAGNHAGMTYLERHFDKRCDPRLLVEGTRSIISVALNYYPQHRIEKDQYQFALYAYGKDYHQVTHRKLNSLFAYINKEVHPVNGRVFCDTAPVLERYWAWRAGLGWIGKNTQLIIPQAGSFFFLGELFLDIELEYDTPLESHCGNCTRCLDACPTEALEQPYKLNARKCLSYLTIENRGDIPVAQAQRLGNKIYGCDECQKACPLNSFAIPCN